MHVEADGFRMVFLLVSGAIFSVNTLNVVNSTFTDNRAAEYGGSIFSMSYLNVIDSTFKSSEDNELIYFSYNDNSGIYGNLNLKNNKMLVKNVAVFYDEYMPYNAPLHLVFTNECAIKGDNVYVCQLENDDGNTFRMGDVNVTLTSQDNLSEIIGLRIAYDSTLGGYVLNTSSFECGAYLLDGNMSENYSGILNVKSGMLYVVDKFVLESSDLTGVYGNINNLTVTLKDHNGNIVPDTYITVELGGETYKLKTNSKGQASVAINLVPKKYVATLSYAGNILEFNTCINVVIKKATPKITAKEKSFKKSIKTKKYTISIKNNKGKAIKNKKLYLKVKGKTYYARTNSKGLATFKITKLTKKGSYQAVITYKESKYYKKVIKKVKITVKI